MEKVEALATLGMTAIATLGVAMLLEAEGLALWQNFAVIGGSLLFLFVAIIAGVATKSVGIAVASGAGITGVVEAYLYPDFAFVMAGIFGTIVALAIIGAYLESRSP